MSGIPRRDGKGFTTRVSGKISKARGSTGDGLVTNTGCYPGLIANNKTAFFGRQFFVGSDINPTLDVIANQCAHWCGNLL